MARIRLPRSTWSSRRCRDSAFSAPLADRGWSTQRTAAAWAELMHRLGYDRYGAVGNDAGSMISPEVGRLDPEHVIGVHVTQVFSFPSGDPAEFEGLSAKTAPRWRNCNGSWTASSRSTSCTSQQPQTLAHALADSPVGLLGWNAQLMTADRWAQALDRRLHPGQRRHVLAHQHRRVGDPVLLRGRARAAAVRADHRPARRGRASPATSPASAASPSATTRTSCNGTCTRNPAAIMPRTWSQESWPTTSAASTRGCADCGVGLQSRDTDQAPEQSLSMEMTDERENAWRGFRSRHPTQYEQVRGHFAKTARSPQDLLTAR